MGELGMALVFKNITDSRGKGDLALNGKEFEIKGNGATLGAKPEGFPVDMSKLEPFGIIRRGTKYEIGEGENMVIIPNKNKFPEALAATYIQTENKDAFKEALRKTLTDDVELGGGVDYLFDKINFDDANNIHQEIALMNLYRYIKKEKFTHFLAHDFGEMDGGNTGVYVYAEGTPESIVDALRGEATFEKVSWNNCRPRIGFSHLYLEEN